MNRTHRMNRYREQVLHAHDHAPSRRWNQPGPLHNARKQGHANAQALRQNTPEHSTLPEENSETADLQPLSPCPIASLVVS